MRFRKKEKFSPRYVNPFEILEQDGVVVYWLALPPKFQSVHPLFHVPMLQIYLPNLSHII